jgi:hypothetical protein
MAITARIPFPLFKVMPGHLAGEPNEWDDDKR